MQNFKILVLLSSFNGERYIEEQIESIEAQENIDVFLVVRDDGSQDSTSKILDKLARKHLNIKIIKGDNVGFVKSFSKLIEYANEVKNEYDYFAFADQDDVWYSNKLSVGCEKLSHLSCSTPNLFCCNSDLINANLEKIGLFKKHALHISRGNVLYYGTFQGCSMVFNKKAVELYANHPPKLAYHDRWMNLICFYLGQTLVDYTPLFAYRIHGGNVIGTNIKKKNLLNDIRKITSKGNNHNLEEIEEFYSTFNKKLSEKDKKIFMTYLNYKNSYVDKLQLAFSYNFGVKYNSPREFVGHLYRVFFEQL